MKFRLFSATHPIGFLYFTTCLLSGATAEEPLLKYLPGDVTNAVAVVRVGEIRDASGPQPVGESLPLPGAEGIPTWIDKLVVGSQVRLGSRERIRTIAVAELQSGTSFSDIASLHTEAPERIGKFAATPTARGDYLVELLPQTIALVRPGVRQEVARWIGAVASGPSPVAPFLKEAAERPQAVVLAVDLRDALSADRVVRWVENQSPVELEGANPTVVAELLARLVGASLAIDLGSETTAEVRVRFNGSISLKAAALRSVFRQLLRETHASIPELEVADAEIDGSDLVLRTPLSNEGVRRVFSLLLAPSDTAPSKPEPGDASPGQPPRTNVANVSQEYFRAVDDAVKDLERANRRATDYARTAVWHENFAQKIEELPTAGADPALVDYGLRTASRLRGLAASLRGVAVDINAEQQTLTYNVQVTPYYVGYDLWGGVGYSPASWQATSNLRDVREKQAASISAGAKQREQIWQMIADDRSAVARAMSDKYGIPFGSATR